MAQEYTSQEVEQIGRDVKDISQIIQYAVGVGRVGILFEHADPYGENNKNRLKERREECENLVLIPAINKKENIEAIARLESQRDNLPNLVSGLLDKLYERIPDLKEKTKVNKE